MNSDLDSDPKNLNPHLGSSKMTVDLNPDRVGFKSGFGFEPGGFGFGFKKKGGGFGLGLGFKTKGWIWIGIGIQGARICTSLVLTGCLSKRLFFSVDFF